MAIPCGQRPNERGGRCQTTPAGEIDAAQGPPWLRASLADLAGFDFEAPIANSQSADSTELSELYRAAAEGAGDTPASRIYAMLAAVTGMQLRAREANDPFDAMVVFADGRRSAAPADFRGPPVEVLAQMAERAKHPALRARLADVSWLLDRKRASLGVTAIAAYVEIVKQVDAGALRLRFENENGALKYDARDLLRRALALGRGLRLEKAELSAARDTVADLRTRSFEQRLPIPAIWYGHLDLDFEISDPSEVGKGVGVVDRRSACWHRRSRHCRSLASGGTGLSPCENRRRQASRSIRSCRAACAHGRAATHGHDRVEHA